MQILISRNQIKISNVLKPKIMKKLKYILMLTVSFFLMTNCEEDQFESDLDYVSFGQESYTAGVDVDGSTTVDVTVYSSQVVNSDVTFNVAVDASDASPGSYAVPNSVTIPSGSNEGTMSIDLSDTDLGIGVNSLVLSFTDVASGFDYGGSTSVNYIQNCNEVSATLDFVFDGYGSEVGWYILDELGGTVLSTGAGAYSDGQASASETLSLCVGRNYTFVVTDSFGDGLSFPADGTYSLTIGGEVKASGGGDYGSEESTDFDTN